jgi:hypothetical protein
MAQLRFEEIFKNLEQRIKTLKKTISELDKDITGQGIQKLEQETKKLTESQKELLQIQKDKNAARKKAATLNRQAIKEADKISQSLDVELQTKKELLKLNQKLTREQAKRLADQKKFGRVQKNSIDALKREAKELTILRNRVNQNSTAFKKYTARLREVNGQLRNTGEAVKDNRANVGNYTGALKKGLSSLKSYAKGLIGISLAFAAIRKVARVAREYIDLATKQILVETKLSTILKERTNATDAQVQSVIELTKKQQELGVLGDEVQIAGAQQFATFVKTTKSVKTLIPAMNDLIVQQKGLNASQGDAVNIANLVGRAFQGQLGSLTRVGISFDEAQGKILKFGTEEEKAAALAEILNQNVGKMNEEIAKTDVGRIQQYNNEIGDLKEEIGKKLIPIFADLKEVARDALKSMSESTSDLSDIFSELRAISRDIRGVEDANEDLKESFFDIGPHKRFIMIAKDISDESRKMTKRIQAVTKAVGELQEQFSMLDAEQQVKATDEFKALQEQFRTGKLSAIEFMNAVNALIATYQNLIKVEEELKETEDERADAARKARKERIRLEKESFKQTQENELATFNLLKLGADKTKAFKIQQNIELLELELSFSDDLTEIQKDTLKKRIELLEIEREAVLGQYKLTGVEIIQEIENIQENIEKTTETTTDGGKGSLLSRLFGFGKTDEGQQIISGALQVIDQIFMSLNDQTQRQIDLIDEQIAKQDEQIEKTEEQLQAEIDRFNTVDEAGQAVSTRRINNFRRQLAAERDALKRSEALRKQAAIKAQRVSIIQANIGIAQAAISGYSSQPFLPVGLAMGSLALLLGGLQLAQIKSQKFATGTDSVPLGDNKPGIDTVHAQLTAGEGVIQKPVNEKIPYHKGFKRTMIPAAAEMYLNSMQGANVYASDNSEVVEELKKVVTNTSNNILRDPITGNVTYKKIGKNEYFYN